MKQCLLLIAIAIFLNGCSKKQNSLRAWNLKGSVKSLISQGFEAKEKFGEIVQGDRSFEESYKAVFDKNGFITDRIEFLTDGSIENKLIFSYTNNKLAQLKVYKASGNVDFTNYFEYKDGLLSKVISKDSNNNLRNTYNINSNADNQIVEEDVYDKNGAKISESKNDYAGGLVVQNIFYDSTGNITWKSTNIYNKNDDLDEIKEYNKDTVIGTKKNKYYYDKYNNWIKKEVYDEKGLPKTLVIRTIEYY